MVRQSGEGRVLSVPQQWLRDCLPHNSSFAILHIHVSPPRKGRQKATDGCPIRSTFTRKEDRMLTLAHVNHSGRNTLDSGESCLLPCGLPGAPCVDIQSGTERCSLLLPPRMIFPHSRWKPLKDRSEAPGDPSPLKQFSFIHSFIPQSCIGFLFITNIKTIDV